jgi:hypothetical protein
LVAIKTQTGAIETDTQDIQGRIPAALTANGNIKASLVEILTTALTETAGLLAAGFKKFFNVAAPTATCLSLPDAVRACAATDAGCLVLGVPPADLGLALAPLRVVRPREGHLVLFPSCLWHGTVPFEDDQARLTVAFDVQPQGTAAAAAQATS